MPYLGEVATARQLGKRLAERYKKYNGRKYIWAACQDCGIERWVVMISGKPASSHCRKCSLKAIHTPEVYAKISEKAKERNIRGSNHPCWKGGYRKTSDGYMVLQLQPGDFFFPMANKLGIAKEHRLIMAKHLNRCLLPWEIVHHKNGIRNDNRLENLILVKSNLTHLPITILQRENKVLQQRIVELEEKLHEAGIRI